MKIEYAVKGIVRAALEAFCLNIFLPLWYLAVLGLKREEKA